MPCGEWCSIRRAARCSSSTAWPTSPRSDRAASRWRSTGGPSWRPSRSRSGAAERRFGGARVPKHHHRVEAYGQVDEVNAAIGLALALESTAFQRDLLQTMQRDLLTIGAELATPDPQKIAKALRDRPVLGQLEVAALERAIDQLEATLPPL